MRTILFRGFTPNEKGREKAFVNGEWIKGQWVQGSYMTFDETTYCFKEDYEAHPDNTKHYIVIDEMTDWGLPNRHLQADVIPETLGQFTGLTDKNGKRIFEGDIILFEDECPGNYEYHDCTEMRCGDMRFDDGQFYLTNRIAVSMEDLIYDGKLNGEIIGNIHAHPELLKGGE